MDAATLARRRQQNLLLTGKPLDSAEEVVRWLGAVQSQDFGAAKWSVAQRTRRLTDAAFDEAFNAGSILRTHVLRPTWHFVLPEDIGWLLELTGPRVRRQMGSYDRKLGLDAAETKRCTALIVKTLRRAGRQTRQELRAMLENAGVEAQGQRLNHIMLNAELTGAICSGGVLGKQQTYALLEERAPNTRSLSPDEALAELTVRFFTSHGPATPKDFRWWSTLPLADIKRGLEMVGAALEHETVEGVTYWFSPRTVARKPRAPRVHLLQPYDEYIVGYTESRRLLDISGVAHTWFPDVFGGALALDGQIVGHYRRTVGKDSVVVDASLFRRFDAAQKKELRAEVDRLGAFLGLPASVETRVAR
ncbi:MAG: winged helix DNA-binding domain-containing protein [Actinomycetota bacterium]